MDTYTKGILTVIAVCLVSITFQLSKTNIIENANAESITRHSINSGNITTTMSSRDFELFRMIGQAIQNGFNKCNP